MVYNTVDKSVLAKFNMGLMFLFQSIKLKRTTADFKYDGSSISS